MQTPTADASPLDSPEEAPTNTPVVMETPVETPRARATPGYVDEMPTPRPAKTPRSNATDTQPTPETVDLAVETPTVDIVPEPEETLPIPEETPDVAAGPTVASMSFTPGSNASLLKIDATTNGGQTIVNVELSGAAKYKILPLPNRRQVWVDFETLELTEPKTFAGSGSSLVKEITARSFEGRLVRVIVQLKDDGKSFPVIGPKKRTGEGTSVAVKIGPDPE